MCSESSDDSYLKIAKITKNELILSGENLIKCVMDY